MTRVKLCGLTRPADIALANRYQPDYVGFVFAHSRRQVTPLQALCLRKALDRRIAAVGVFVNEAVERVASIVQSGAIDLVQLHGDENAAYVARLHTLVQCPVIRAVAVRSAEDIRAAQTFPSDYLLLDTYHAATRGGSGIAWDYRMLDAGSRPFFLAGGLNAETVADAIRQVRPFAVDLSSGAEVNGVKNEEKIREIMRKVRGIPAGGNHE